MSQARSTNWAYPVPIGMAEGISTRSKRHPDPVMHVLAMDGPSWATWCGGTPALKENTVWQRKCPRCQTLLREMRAENVE